MTSSASLRHQAIHTSEQDPFLNLRIHQDTLMRLLSRHQLHVEDLHCHDQGSACRLKRLLLGCVTRRC